MMDDSCKKDAQDPAASFAQQLLVLHLGTFWKLNKLYEIKEWRTRGPKVITFVVVLGGECYYAVGCCIPPTDLTTLTHVKAAW
jgi:hypothetical protein